MSSFEALKDKQHVIPNAPTGWGKRKSDTPSSAGITYRKPPEP